MISIAQNIGVPAKLALIQNKSRTAEAVLPSIISLFQDITLSRLGVESVVLA